MPTPNSPPAVRRLETGAASAAIALALRLGERVRDPALDRVIRRLAERHPRAFEALGRLRSARMLIDPVDQPAAIELLVGSEIRVRIVERDGVQADARVRGPLAALMDLMEGRIDGDALFFRRELRVEGDTELVVAVRNAFDGDDMDLAVDIASLLGPMEYAVDPARRGLVRLFGALDSARAAFLEPVTSRLDSLERRLDRREKRDLRQE